MKKMCSRCKKMKNTTEFGGHKGHKDGLMSQCRKCDRKQKRDFYKANKVFVLSRNAEWVRKNRGKVNEINKQWEKRNPDKVREKYRRWRETHRPQVRIIIKKYRENHPLKTQAHDAIHYAVRRGKMSRVNTKKCSECNQRQAEHYHHHKGYEKEHWLNVIPVCRICHKRLDKITPVRSSE